MRHIIWIFIVGAFLITGCNNDAEEPVNQTELDLIGEWTAKEISVLAMVNGEPMIQWIQEELGLTDVEALLFEELFLQELADGLSGTITFNADKSYSLKFGDDPEEIGTWLLSNNNQTLTLTSDDTMELEVITLTASTLKIGFEEMESGDLNDDGTDDELVINLELTLEK